MICGLCKEGIEPEFAYINCPNCFSKYHIDHLKEWTKIKWICIECDNDVKSLLQRISIIVVLYSDKISVGFEGEKEPRATIPLKIGKRKYQHFDYDMFDPKVLERFDIIDYHGMFGQDIQSLRGVLKDIPVYHRSKIIDNKYFLQLLHHCFFEILKINPLYHNILVSNTVITTKDQRILLRDLLLDVFGFPHLFMSSHQYFSIIGKGSQSGLCIEFALDLIIIFVIYQGKILHKSTRIDFLSEKEMRDYKVNLKKEARDRLIIKTILGYVKDALKKIESKELIEIGQNIVVNDPDQRIYNHDQLIFKLRDIMELHDLSSYSTPEISSIDDEVIYDVWNGINRFLSLDMLNNLWIDNLNYRELSQKFLTDKKRSLEQKKEIQSKVNKILEEFNYEIENKKLFELKVSSKDLEIAAQIPNFYRIIVKPVENDDLGALMAFADLPDKHMFSIVIEPDRKESHASHSYPKVEYLWIIEIDAYLSFTDDGYEIIRRYYYRNTS